jgi:hypothetical protein
MESEGKLLLYKPKLLLNFLEEDIYNFQSYGIVDIFCL